MHIRVDTRRVRETGRRLIATGDRLAEIGHELQNAISSLDTRAWDGVSRARAAAAVEPGGAGERAPGGGVGHVGPPVAARGRGV